VTKSGIIIPGTTKETKISGEVVQVGPGTGNKPMEVVEGDVITYESLSAVEIEIGNEKLDLIDSSNIIHIN